MDSSCPDTGELLWRKAGTFLQRFSTPKPPRPAPSLASPSPPPTLLLAAALKPGRGFLLWEPGLASTLQGFAFLRHLCRGWGSGVLFPHPQPPPHLGEESEGGVSWRGGSRGEGWGDGCRRREGTLEEQGGSQRQGPGRRAGTESLRPVPADLRLGGCVLSLSVSLPASLSRFPSPALLPLFPSPGRVSPEEKETQKNQGEKAPGPSAGFFLL